VYWINGTLTASDIAAKLWGAWHGLAGRGDDAAVIVAYTEGSGAEAEARLNRFLSSQLGKVALRLQAARDTGTEPPP
jgi:EpsI family protein